MKAIINGKLVFPDEIRNGNLIIDGDTIIEAGTDYIPEDAEIIDAEGLYVGPGLIDQHSHGYQQYGEAVRVVDDPAGTARAHLKHGTTTFIPSTDYKFNVEQHINIIDMCRAAMADEDSSIMGVHLEGPWINKRYGASSDTAMDYNYEASEAIYAAAEGIVLHSTYAPELPQGTEIEATMRKHNIRPAVGHSGAGPEDIERAYANGARIVTHLYDATGCYIDLSKACSTGHPQDCTSDILLAMPDMYYELIVDKAGAHATKYSVMRALKTAGEDRIILISDATVRPFAGASGDINYNDRGQLSGSRLCINMAVKNFMNFTGADIRVAFKCGATNSARALGINDKVGSIETGRKANILLVDDKFDIKKILFKGNEIPEIRN